MKISWESGWISVEAHLHWRSRAHHLVLYDLVITSSIIKRDLLGTFWSMQEYVQWHKSCLQDGRICLRSISWRSPFILKSTGRILLPCSLRKGFPRTWLYYSMKCESTRFQKRPAPGLDPCLQEILTWLQELKAHSKRFPAPFCNLWRQ